MVAMLRNTQPWRFNFHLKVSTTYFLQSGIVCTSNSDKSTSWIINKNVRRKIEIWDKKPLRRTIEGIEDKNGVWQRLYNEETYSNPSITSTIQSTKSELAGIYTQNARRVTKKAFTGG